MLHGPTSGEGPGPTWALTQLWPGLVRAPLAPDTLGPWDHCRPGPEEPRPTHVEIRLEKEMDRQMQAVRLYTIALFHALIGCPTIKVVTPTKKVALPRKKVVTAPGSSYPPPYPLHPQML